MCIMPFIMIIMFKYRKAIAPALPVVPQRVTASYECGRGKRHWRQGRFELSAQGQPEIGKFQVKNDDYYGKQMRIARLTFHVRSVIGLLTSSAS